MPSFTSLLMHSPRYRDNRIKYQKPKNRSKLNDLQSIPVIPIRDFIIRDSDCPANSTEEEEIKIYMSKQSELSDDGMTDEIRDYLNNEIRKDEISLADDYTEADEPLW